MVVEDPIVGEGITVGLSSTVFSGVSTCVGGAAVGITVGILSSAVTLGVGVGEMEFASVK